MSFVDSQFFFYELGRAFIKRELALRYDKENCLSMPSLLKVER